MADLILILSTNINDPNTQNILKTFNPSLSNPVIKHYSDGTSYYCYNQHGVSIATNSSTGLITSIDLYQDSKDYKPVPKTLIPSLYNHRNIIEFTEKFGEPLEKGGGIKSQPIDIWLRWQRFEITVKSKQWSEEAAKQSWSSLTIFDR